MKTNCRTGEGGRKERAFIKIKKSSKRVRKKKRKKMRRRRDYIGRERVGR